MAYEMNLQALFPQPVGLFQFDRDLTEKEKKFIMGQEQRPNMGNTTSVDTYILKNNALKGLREFIETCLNTYFKEVVMPKDDVSVYITQSWLNYTNKGQFHHKHAHPNSYISGVFYVNGDVEKDKIYFYNDGYKQIKLESVGWNRFNSESWWFEAMTGRLVLFPSSLTHMVEAVTAEQTRVSLSFNTFLKGTIGSNNSLTELKN